MYKMSLLNSMAAIDTTTEIPSIFAASSTLETGLALLQAMVAIPASVAQNYIRVVFRKMYCLAITAEVG